MQRMPSQGRRENAEPPMRGANSRHLVRYRPVRSLETFCGEMAPQRSWAGGGQLTDVAAHDFPQGNLVKIILLSVFYLVAMMITAHFFMPPEYHWLRNTVSDLAAQGLPYRRIMQLGFVGFGLLLNAGLVARFVSANKGDPQNALSGEPCLAACRAMVWIRPYLEDQNAKKEVGG